LISVLQQKYKYPNYTSFQLIKCIILFFNLVILYYHSLSRSYLNDCYILPLAIKIAIVTFSMTPFRNLLKKGYISTQQNRILMAFAFQANLPILLHAVSNGA